MHYVSGSFLRRSIRLKKGSTSVTTPTNGTNPIIVTGTGMNKSKQSHGIAKLS